MSVARDVQQAPPRLKDLLFHFEPHANKFLRLETISLSDL